MTGIRFAALGCQEKLHDGLSILSTVSMRARSFPPPEERLRLIA